MSAQGRRGPQCLPAGRDSVNDKGYHQILGIVEGAKEDKAGCRAFLEPLGAAAEGNRRALRQPSSRSARSSPRPCNMRLGKAGELVETTAPEIPDDGFRPILACQIVTTLSALFPTTD